MKVTLSNSASRSVRNDNNRLASFRTQTITVPIGPHSPAFFEYRETCSDRTLAAAIDEQYRVITSANPARSGKMIQLFMNGLGGVMMAHAPFRRNQSNDAAKATKMSPTVSIGGFRRQSSSAAWLHRTLDLSGELCSSGRVTSGSSLSNSRSAEYRPEFHRSPMMRKIHFAENRHA